MLIDLLNSSNYIMVNMDAIHTFGLNTAVYCSALLNIYKKAVTKNKLYNETYFKIDREYIKKQTSLEIEEQLKCDINLRKVNIIKQDESDPDIIQFDVEIYASILSSEDVKLLASVSSKVKVNNPKNVKQVQRDRIIVALKESIECKTLPVLQKLQEWIDSIMADPKRYLSKQQVAAFKRKLDDYCEGDLEKAFAILDIATIHSYVDCQWAINVLEQKNRPVRSSMGSTQVRVTEQKKTVELGTEEF